MTVLVSTGGFANLSAVESASLLISAEIQAIELSGGQWSQTALQDLLRLCDSANLVPHNYFPPPKIPFVFNLASPNIEIQKASMEHVRKAMSWCQQLGASVYSFHAGFLIDPVPSELGKRIKSRQIFDREKSRETFLKAVTLLSSEADDLGIRLMVENNVLSQTNFETFGENPLLMVDPEECQSILNQLPPSVGLLLDVAHLKVSATTLDFPLDAVFESCGNRISGYHLSENYGLEDTNGRISVDDWYWQFIKPQVDYISIEVYGESCDFLRQQQLMVEKMLAKLKEGPENDA
jgi:sugar phosphate isomerase/epimerase